MTCFVKIDTVLGSSYISSSSFFFGLPMDGQETNLEEFRWLHMSHLTVYSAYFLHPSHFPLNVTERGTGIGLVLG